MMNVWKHPTLDILRVQLDEDQIVEIDMEYNLPGPEVTEVPGDWVEIGGSE